MRKFIYTFALALVVGVSMLGPTLAANAAVPSGIDALINGGNIYNTKTGTSTAYNGVWDLMVTFISDILDNYTSLLLWLGALVIVIVAIIGVARRFMGGGARR